MVKKGKRESYFHKLVISSIGQQVIVSVLFFICLVYFSSQIIGASYLNCTIGTASSCVGTGNVSLFRLQNESGGYMNAHAQNDTLLGYSPIYTYSSCCYSNTTSLSTSCAQSTILKLSNFTNAHVQVGNYSGPYTIYTNKSCLSANPGKVTCTYTESSCAAGYVCLASIASSETAYDNISNAHIGPCNEYLTKICCSLNSAPNITSVRIVSTNGNNRTYENLTVLISVIDYDADLFVNITDWRKNDKSIALLNMPFDTNIDSTSSNSIRDYSTYLNNGTLGEGTVANAPNWTSNGKIGGAYKYDGLNDYIQVDYAASLAPVNGITISAWFNSSNVNANQRIVSKTQTGGYQISLNENSACPINTLCFLVDVGGSNYYTSYAVTNLANHTWYHVAGTYDGETIRLYVNNAEVNNNPSPSGSIGYTVSNPFCIGSEASAAACTEGNYFNGTIDYLFVSNYSLSANQIKIIYNAGMASRYPESLHSDETRKFENWSVAVTANDGNDDSRTVSSSNLTIRGSRLNVTLVSPSNGNYTRLRQPTFSWNLSDVDINDIRYEFALNSSSLGGGPNCIESFSNYSFNGVKNYTPVNPLKCFYDNLYQYNWSVRANDSEETGQWTPIWSVNMTAVVNISMPVDFITFGTLMLDAFDNTTDGSPAPFQLQNEGNCIVNVSVNASSLWASASNPTNYYRFKIRETSETNSFNESNSTMSWSMLSSTLSPTVALLNYSDLNDSAFIDIYVMVPLNEPPGNKTSDLMFSARLSE